MSVCALQFTCDRLKDVSDINASSLPANTDPDYQFDYLEISNVNYYGIVDPNDIERLRFEDAPSRARRCVLQSDTLISSVRPNLQAAAFIHDALSDFVCSTGFNVVRPSAVKVKPKVRVLFAGLRVRATVFRGGRQRRRVPCRGRQGLRLLCYAPPAVSRTGPNHEVLRRQLCSH